ncbi:MAG: TULIP family P47-like protein, partial [Gammaproteobacteria bacterium]|nr:TULIP family P47-like protein [Gammaproteobacteria bacterium]
QDWTRKSEGVIVLQWILSAISVIAGILAFVPGINAAAIPVLIIAALLSGGGLLSMKLIEAIKGDDAPPLDLLVANTTKAVTWANGEQFELTSVELNGALQLAGNFRGAALRL